MWIENGPIQSENRLASFSSIARLFLAFLGKVRAATTRPRKRKKACVCNFLHTHIHTFVDAYINADQGPALTKATSLLYSSSKAL